MANVYFRGVSKFVVIVVIVIVVYCKKRTLILDQKAWLGNGKGVKNGLHNTTLIELVDS